MDLHKYEKKSARLPGLTRETLAGDEDCENNPTTYGFVKFRCEDFPPHIEPTSNKLGMG